MSATEASVSTSLAALSHSNQNRMVAGVLFKQHDMTRLERPDTNQHIRGCEKMLKTSVMGFVKQNKSERGALWPPDLLTRLFVGRYRSISVACSLPTLDSKQIDAKRNERNEIKQN